MPDSSKVICQFCQESGRVTVRSVRRKKRKTFTRFLAAGDTAGASLPVAGVSKKGHVTELHCGNLRRYVGRQRA